MAALQPVLLVVCAIGIIVGIAVPVVWLFRPETVHRKAPPLPMAFRLVLIEVMFALTAIMAILFGIDSQLSEKVSFEFRVGGPFAAFLGSTLLILFFGNKDDVKQAALAQQIVGAVQDQLPGQLVAAIKDRVSEELVPLVQGDMCEELAKAIEKAETASEWQSYEKFKEGLNGFEEINAKEEEYFVRNLLGAGYSPSEQVQVETATITTAFLYLGDQPEKGSVVKLQRVCGKTLSKTKPAKVRFRSFSSYGTRGLRSVILISETSAPPTILKSDCDADVTGRERDSRAEIATVDFDYLIMTLYPEYPKHEDYLLVDASRFCKEGNETEMAFAVSSTHKPIRLPSGWQMKKPRAMAGGRIPLRFKKHDTGPKDGWGKVLKELLPWVRCVDEQLAKGPLKEKFDGPVFDLAKEIRQAVVAAVSDAKSASPANLEESLGLLKDKTYNLSVAKVTETLLVLFTWQ